MPGTHEQVSVEQRAAALLRTLLAERGKSIGELAGKLGSTGEPVRRMLAGEGHVELDRLDAVLAALDVEPAEFFARLYGGGGVTTAADSPDAEPEDPSAEGARGDGAASHDAAASPAAGTDRRGPEDEPITRREVEQLLGELRSTIHGMVRLIDAERESSADGDD